MNGKRVGFNSRQRQDTIFLIKFLEFLLWDAEHGKHLETTDFHRILPGNFQDHPLPRKLCVINRIIFWKKIFIVETEEYIK